MQFIFLPGLCRIVSNFNKGEKLVDEKIYYSYLSLVEKEAVKDKHMFKSC